MTTSQQAQITHSAESTEADEVIHQQQPPGGCPAQAALEGRRGMVDAVIPAHNEETTVRAVAKALLASRLFGRVIVVDDGSTDRTAAQAEHAGAEVLRLFPNRGKGAAMLAGVARSEAPAIAFFDADAVGLRPEHAQLLVDHFAKGFTQVCGVQDHGWLNPLHVLALPLVTGQRIVRRWVLDRLPETCGGYSIETAINYLVDKHGGSTCVATLPGATFRHKTEKVGLVGGLLGNLRMVGAMRSAYRTLDETNGAACAIEPGAALTEDWSGWMQDAWARLTAGRKLRLPASLPHPRLVGFQPTRLAAPVGQIADWALPLADGSRLHAWELPDRAVVVHRDRIDPGLGPASAVQHWMSEAAAAQARGLAAFLRVFGRGLWSGR